MTATTGRALVVWIPGPVRSPQVGGHKHWAVRARAVKDQRTKAMLLLREAAAAAGWPPPLRHEPKVITMVASVHNIMDTDNLGHALKATRDACKDAGLIDDDSPRAGHRFVYEQEIDRKRPGVMVRVERVEG